MKTALYILASAAAIAAATPASAVTLIVVDGKLGQGTPFSGTIDYEDGQVTGWNLTLDFANGPWTFEYGALSKKPVLGSITGVTLNGISEIGMRDLINLDLPASGPILLTGYSAGGFSINSFLSVPASYTLYPVPPANIAAPVPEPTSWAMMIGGFGLMGGLMRRRQQANVRYSLA